MSLGSFTVRTTCRFCDKSLTDVIHMGDCFPLAGGFLRDLSEVKNEKVFPLSIGYCVNCCLMQCKQVVDSDVLFKRGYFYYSSMIPALVKHFTNHAEKLAQMYLKPSETKVLEIGCNDGVMLRPLKKLGFQTIGVDPSDTVKDLIKDGFEIYNTYFNEETAQNILSKHGLVDLFLSSNSFAHIDDMKAIMGALKLVLKPGGLAIIEVHYAKAVIDNLNFDFIYHEHMSYYTVTSFLKISEMFAMTIENVEFIPVHGESIRVILRNRVQSIPRNVAALLELEKHYTQMETYSKFAKTVMDWQKEFTEFYSNIRKTGAKVYGYGSSGRANTICTYVHLDIDEIIDDAQSKIGMYMPLTHKQIRSSEIISKSPPDYIIILAWPYANDIMRKVRKIYSGKFIIPLPKIAIVD